MDEIWITAAGLGRCKIIGNSHTFHGRIEVWSESLDHAAAISKSDVLEATPEAWSWIDGYLAGNEPSLAEYLNIDPVEAMDIDQGDPRYLEWDRALTSFRETGSIRIAWQEEPLDTTDSP